MIDIFSSLVSQIRPMSDCLLSSRLTPQTRIWSGSSVLNSVSLLLILSVVLCA